VDRNGQRAASCSARWLSRTYPGSIGEAEGQYIGQNIVKVLLLLHQQLRSARVATSVTDTILFSVTDEQNGSARQNGHSFSKGGGSPGLHKRRRSGGTRSLQPHALLTPARASSLHSLGTAPPLIGSGRRHGKTRRIVRFAPRSREGRARAQGPPGRVAPRAAAAGKSPKRGGCDPCSLQQCGLKTRTRPPP
jgi:hypothetical protein